jgi:hypothetical protein
MREPTRLKVGEGRCAQEITRRSPERLAGVVEAARREREDRATREVSARDEVLELRAPGWAEMAERLAVPMKPVKTEGGKGPQF